MVLLLKTIAQDLIKNMVIVLEEFKQYNIFQSERDVGQKGGLLTIIKKSLNIVYFYVS